MMLRHDTRWNFPHAVPRSTLSAHNVARGKEHIHKAAKVLVVKEKAIEKVPQKISHRPIYPSNRKQKKTSQET